MSSTISLDRAPAPSRRSLFGAGAALLAGGALLATAARKPLPDAPSPDAEIIELCGQFVALIEEQDRLCELDETCTGPIHDQYEAMWPERRAIADRLYDLPYPVTIEGARAMARAALADAEKELDGSLATRCVSDWLAFSAIEFLVGGDVS